MKVIVALTYLAVGIYAQPAVSVQESRVVLLGALLLAGTGWTGAEELTAKPLPGNKRCPYPPEAQRQYVAGPVRFAAHVRPDGVPESVDVQKVPAPGLGFEDTVRTCVAEWRFEPGVPGATGLRRHEGRMRFRVDLKEETAIRALLESLASAWNTGDMKALEGLTGPPGAAPAVDVETGRSVRTQLEDKGGQGTWRLELEPDVERIRFFEPTAVNVTQGYRRMSMVGPTGQAAKPELSVLDVFAAKGPEGWRLVSLHVGTPASMDPVRIGGPIREPRKVKDARPIYPEGMKAARIQGAVILEAVISPTGNVVSVKVLRGVHARLDAAAVEAVRKWVYTPTLLEGVAVPVIMTVTVNFRIS